MAMKKTALLDCSILFSSRAWYESDSNMFRGDNSMVYWVGVNMQCEVIRNDIPYELERNHPISTVTNICPIKTTYFPPWLSH